MSCPAWHPVCQAQTAVGIVADAADGMSKGYRATTGALDLAGRTYGAVDRITDPIGGPFVAGAGLFLLLSLWVLWKLFGVGRQVVPAAVAGYTGVDVGKARQPKQAGRTMGERARQRVERTRGPATQAHLGSGLAEVIDRQDDRQGRPVRVVVCAADPGAAADAVGARMTGHTWSHGGSKRCSLDRSRHHFTLTKRGARR